jgi:hypothetical protein
MWGKYISSHLCIPISQILNKFTSSYKVGMNVMLLEIAQNIDRFNVI